MPIRNTHRVGDYLLLDDESGLVHYASDMVKDWDGQMRHKDNLDGRHPQLDVGKAVRRDPQALTDIRPQTYQEVASCAYSPAFVGNTTVPTKLGPGVRFPGIGDMIIGCDCPCVFVVV